MTKQLLGIVQALWRERKKRDPLSNSSWSSAEEKGVWCAVCVVFRERRMSSGYGHQEKLWGMSFEVYLQG
jgi:hypothetical protein